MRIWIQVLSHEFMTMNESWIHFWMQSWIQIWNCLICNCRIPTSCRSIVVIVSALWQTSKNQQANTAKQLCIAMQLKCNLLHFQQADCSRHHRWTATQDKWLLGVILQALSMTPSMDAWAALSMAPSMESDGRWHKTIDCLVSYRRHYRWPHRWTPGRHYRWPHQWTPTQENVLLGSCLFYFSWIISSSLLFACCRNSVVANQKRNRNTQKRSLLRSEHGDV